MLKIVRRLRIPLAVLLVAVAGLWLGNNSTLVNSGNEPLLLAHRGLAQTFDVSRVQADTCTAQVILPPEHPYLENTLDSMRAAFDAGADVVEFDVKLTRDGRLAVFHDAVLECRTDASGTVGEHTMDELRALDIGYGYTADGGVTYPFRGKGVGLMPDAPEVLDAFAGRELLIHLKNDNAADGEALAELLAERPHQQLTVYGEDTAVAAFHTALPGVRATSKAMMKNCLLRYESTGWTGHVPDACRNTQLHLPARYGRWLWGWPNRFANRMAEAGTRVILVADGGDYSAGFDTPETVNQIPENWPGGIWTNRIDVAAPLIS
ncbi:glycerophosphoryl diester phosphodiesterase [Actinoplanes lutulentus]|uniref:Glycerophosphoryl diester phosphodiesterase n=1 Tax=Actinoplanes lutulentus TaxID=1287878 RepID=A0A327ZL42_9ACTN|nr:glycerophosphodiester phosphodiesterase family protein [Actinoplanes lutulentus]MBB2941104.1 glycerophosphoryl diester phosphodiesterase [Actinoplanes lutulentus]RAK43413.1 glycerophosphoryl diester phosphodiesterase [Actinoplanes lutulentus]